MTTAKQMQLARAANTLYQNSVLDLEGYLLLLHHIKIQKQWHVTESAEAQNVEQTKLILSQEEESDYKISDNGVPIINTKKAIKNG